MKPRVELVVLRQVITCLFLFIETAKFSIKETSLRLHKTIVYDKLWFLHP